MGIPGTGLSARTKLSGSGPNRRGRDDGDTGLVTARATAEVGDDGELRLFAEDGAPLPEDHLAALKRQQPDELRDLLARGAAQANEPIRVLETVHCTTPNPSTPIPIEPTSFGEPPPSEPGPIRIRLHDRLLPGRAQQRRDEAAREMELYERALAAWRDRKAAHDRQEAEWRALFEAKRNTDVEVMGTVLEHQFLQLQWPRETLVSFDILEGGRVVVADVDFPEVEDMPETVASAPGNRWRVMSRPLTEAARRASGHVEDEYLLSVRVRREDWRKLNFAELEVLDPVESFEKFHLARKMTKSGIFRPIEPLSPE
jgi:hypothetical protein